MVDKRHMDINKYTILFHKYKIIYNINKKKCDGTYLHIALLS